MFSELGREDKDADILGKSIAIMAARVCRYGELESIAIMSDDALRLAQMRRRITQAVARHSKEYPSMYATEKLGAGDCRALSLSHENNNMASSLAMGRALLGLPFVSIHTMDEIFRNIFLIIFRY